MRGSGYRTAPEFVLPDTAHCEENAAVAARGGRRDAPAEHTLTLSTTAGIRTHLSRVEGFARRFHGLTSPQRYPQAGEGQGSRRRRRPRRANLKRLVHPIRL